MGLISFRFEYTNTEYFNNVEYFFVSFKDYIDQVEEWIVQEVGTAKDKLKKFEQDLQQDPRWEDEWFIHHDELRQKSLLRVIYYESLILTIYSFTEKQLFFVCKKLEQGYDMKLEDVAGKGIFKYRKYLEKVAGIDFSEISNQWNVLLKFNTIRNHLVHSHSFRLFPASNNNLKQSLSYFPSVVLNENNNEIGFDFKDTAILSEFCTISREIIDHLYHRRH